jgi:hypothetical protein
MPDRGKSDGLVVPAKPPNDPVRGGWREGACRRETRPVNHARTSDLLSSIPIDIHYWPSGADLSIGDGADCSDADFLPSTIREASSC